MKNFDNLKKCNNFVITQKTTVMDVSVIQIGNSIEVKHNNKKGWVVLDQIRTIDKQRIYKVINCLTIKEIEKVKMTIKELLVD